MNRRLSFDLSDAGIKLICIIIVVVAEIILLTLMLHTKSTTEGIESSNTNTPTESSPPIGWQPIPKDEQSRTDQEARVDPEITKSSTYYSVHDGMLHHNTNGDEATGSFIYGPAADFMSENQKYYSRDGHTFFDSDGKEVGTAYQYFEILPLNTKTSYTANQLNEYIEKHIPEAQQSKMGGPGPLATLGNAFISAQDQYGVNALYLLAHAIHESAWGSSSIAQTKHNLYGFGAIDSDPYDGAKEFADYQENINYVAQFISDQYQDPKGDYYYGTMLGNKEMGMNVKYASDEFWGQQIAGYMYRIDKELGGEDFGKFSSDPYSIAVSTVDAPVNVRAQPSASNGEDIAYNLPGNGTAMIVSGQVSNDDGTWFEIFSDESNFLNPETAYTYHKGSQGELSEIVNIAGGK